LLYAQIGKVMSFQLAINAHFHMFSYFVVYVLTVHIINNFTLTVQYFTVY